MDCALAECGAIAINAATPKTVKRNPRICICNSLPPECYMETVGSILALLEKLKGKLRLGEGEVCIKNPPIDISRNQKFADMKLIYIYLASLDYKSNCQWNGTLRI